MNSALNINLITALVAAQMEFQPIEKNCEGVAEDGSTYRYADLDEVLDKTRPALNRHGLVLFSKVTTEGDKVLLRCSLAHVSGEREVAELQLVHHRDLRDFGGKVKQLRRYQAEALLGVTAGEEGGLERGEAKGEKVLAGMACHPDISAAQNVGELTRAMSKLSRADKATFADHFTRRQAELTQPEEQAE